MMNYELSFAIGFALDMLIIELYSVLNCAVIDDHSFCIYIPISAILRLILLVPPFTQSLQRLFDNAQE